MKRPTLRDIADRAKVGTATVERVLNGRGGVSSQLAERVLRTAKILRYGERQRGLRSGLIRIEVILIRSEQEYYTRLDKGFARIAASLDPSIAVHRTFVRTNDSVGLAHYIARPPFRRAGLIVVAPEHPAIAESLQLERSAGVEVIQIITRCTGNNVPYVGIDNYAAGRTAAYFASEMTQGSRGNFVALCSGPIYWAQRERVRGFTDYLLERANPNQTISRVVLGHDDDLVVGQRLRETLLEHHPVVALYTTAPTNSVAGILAARPDRVFWIGHWLTPQTAKYPRSGVMDMVIDQAPEAHAHRAMHLVLRRLGLIEVEVSVEPIQFLTVTAQNLPDSFTWDKAGGTTRHTSRKLVN